MGSLKALRYFALVAFLIQAFPAHATVIDNDLTAGTLGYWSVDVTTGGESRTAFITANRLVTADVSTQEIIYDYFSYVDVGNDGGGFQLSGSAPAVDPGDSDRVSSSGTFTGANGNDIQWTVVSSIADNSPTMTNVLTFTATTGTLGVLRFLQYMDEDIQGVSDDVFFTRGSLASNDLELFTVDNAEVYGVSHSGAFSSAAGLANATFAGWAADHFNNMKPRITGAGQSVAPAGVITNLPATTHPIVGSAFGPADIVSVLAWDVDPEATTATIVTTLGGVPDVSNVQCGNGSPEEGEECDDGNVVTTDGCTNDCTICGNEVTTAPEECDDGNIVDGDGCSAACELEAATGVCGDENLDPGEECDDGNLENFDGCSATCTIEPGCGNGRLENDEQCDDGNTVSGDGCSASCSLEAICGDGNVDTGEQCDDGNTVNGDGCSATCTIEPFCGDGNVDTGEQCDDGNTVNGDGCSATCTIEPFCGDGNVDTGEECDDGNTVNGDGCSATCTVEEITDRCALACALPGAIHGTPGRDVMVGTKADETLCGEGGNDYIIGGGGADTLCGGPGNDLLRGGQQADYLDGGEGNDRLNGMGGPDIVRGGVGNDVVRGGEGADVLEGGEDDDRLFGVGGDDLLDGGPGNDRLNGGLGGDTCVNGERTTRCE